jgi:hypothetical protein
MRASHHASLRGFGRALRFTLPALATVAVLATPTLASGAQTPEYSLSIVEGANTRPENSVQHVSAEASHPKAEVVVSIAHNGLVVDKNTGDDGVWLSQVPQVGDVVALESPAGVLRGAVVYDGLPSLDPTVCAGSSNFSGQRTAGYTVEGAYYTAASRHSYYAAPFGGQAQVQVLSGSAFAGSFLKPLVIGESIYATEALSTPIAGGNFTYSSENDRPVGACPVPPPPPPPPPPLALAGSFAKFARTTIHRLLRSGWSTQVRINQPGRVVEDLYQHQGSVPAFAATSKRKRSRKPPAVLLARGTVTAKSAGTVTVTMHATSKGRRLLKHAHSVRTVLVTTLSTTSGTKLTLERHSLTLHR